MKLKLLKNDRLTVPFQATENDAGYDIVATSEPKIVGSSIKTKSGEIVWRSIDYIEYDTALYVCPEYDQLYLDIRPRSSISKYNLVLANSVGLIDSGYRGEIKCRFKYIFQPEDIFVLKTDDGNVSTVMRVNKNKIYNFGDKIAQLQMKMGANIEFQLVSELPSSERGVGGFGHTK